MDHLTLHVRLNKACNAVCDYCSAHEVKHDQRMKPAAFEQALAFIVPLVQRLGLGGARRHLAVQYVGGEILLIPPEELQAIVETARAAFAPLFDTVVDGCQSNLIGSDERIDHLMDLFHGRIGTSIDRYTERRRVQGSARKYRTIFMRQHQRSEERFQRPLPAILVVDRASGPFVLQEIQDAHRKGYGLTLRPVFHGGAPVDALSSDELATLYETAFDRWFLRQRVVVQPFFQLVTQRWGKRQADRRTAGLPVVIGDTQAHTWQVNNHGCPSQHNCAQASLDLEPNGDLYICLDTADSGQLRLGNALTGAWDDTLWARIQARSTHLSQSCYSCDYFHACQGGCMSEALHTSHDVFGKTEHCSVWKRLFARIDGALDAADPLVVERWLQHLDRQGRGTIPTVPVPSIEFAA